MYNKPFQIWYVIGKNCLGWYLCAYKSKRQSFHFTYICENEKGSDAKGMLVLNNVSNNNQTHSLQSNDVCTSYYRGNINAFNLQHFACCGAYF